MYEISEIKAIYIDNLMHKKQSKKMYFHII